MKCTSKDITIYNNGIINTMFLLIDYGLTSTKECLEQLSDKK